MYYKRVDLFMMLVSRGRMRNVNLPATFAGILYQKACWLNSSATFTYYYRRIMLRDNKSYFKIHVLSCPVLYVRCTLYMFLADDDTIVVCIAHHRQPTTRMYRIEYSINGP